MPQNFEPGSSQNTHAYVAHFADRGLGVVEFSYPRGAQKAEALLLADFVDVAIPGRATANGELAALVSPGDGGAVHVGLHLVEWHEVFEVLADFIDDPVDQALTQARHTQIDLALGSARPGLAAGSTEQRLAFSPLPGFALVVQQQGLDGDQLDQLGLEVSPYWFALQAISRPWSGGPVSEQAGRALVGRADKDLHHWVGALSFLGQGAQLEADNDGQPTADPGRLNLGAHQLFHNGGPAPCTRTSA